MKKLYFLITLFVAACSSNAQIPSYGWAKLIGGDALIFVNGITVGPDGNPVVACNFSNGVPVTIGDTTIENHYSQTAMLLVKYDANGNVIWVNSAGAGQTGYYGNAEAQGMSSDNNGNFYFTGEYNDSLIFSSNVALPDESNDSLENSYTVKYNSSGTPLWARRIKGAVGESTACDQVGSVAMAGLFFFADSITLSDTVIANPDTNNDVSFIIKYDENGNRLWQKIADGAVFYTLATDKDGNLYASGYLSGDSAVFDAYTLYNSDGVSGINDIFVVKYNPSGMALWARGFGGVGDDEVNAICISANNQINITGNFDSPELDFGNIPLTNPVGANFVFVARLDSSGNPLWATSSQLDNALAITADAANSVFISGDFLDTTVIIGMDTLNNYAPENLFVAKYDSSGNFIWAETTPGTGAVTGCLIANDTRGNSYIATNFQDANLQLGSTVLTPGESIDVAVAKLDNTGVATGIQPVNPSQINVYPNPTGGRIYISGLTPGSGIEIYNLLGEKIYSAVAENEIQQINLNAPAKGMYIYRVTGNNMPPQSGKIVIE